MRRMGGLTRVVALIIVAWLCALLVGCPRASAPAGSGAVQTPAAPTKTSDKPGEPARGAGEKAGPAWVMSMAEGAKTAAAEGKPMMVDFYADWCHWCAKLDEETYSDAQVIAKSKEFVCVKVDTEKDSESASKYSVEGLPTILFLDSSGSKIHEKVGYASAAEFLTEMDTALSKAKGG